MIPIGTEVKIGSKYGHEHFYDSIVNYLGTIVREPCLDGDYMWYQVRVLQKDGFNLTWSVREEDCILVEPKSNRDALRMLIRR